MIILVTPSDVEKNLFYQIYIELCILGGNPVVFLQNRKTPQKLHAHVYKVDIRKIWPLNRTESDVFIEMFDCTIEPVLNEHL